MAEALPPWQRLIHFLVEDRRDLIVLLIYTLLNGLLMLAVPLAAQALVNTIAAGVFLQPLVVLSLLLFLGLLFAGVMRLMQLVLVEIIQQRIFAKVALRLAYRLPRIRFEALRTQYAPELVNRFFDVLTIQKTWSKILLDVPSSVLQILVGLMLLALYSPLLLAFDIALLSGILFSLFALGFGGLRTSIQESYQKYAVAGWLEEIGRCHISFKTAGLPPLGLDRADKLIVKYLTARGQHFKVLLRHATATYLLYALAGAGVLALGGWLVINRQLTLGQLVAAEIVVVSVLAAFEKLMRQVEPFYDLLTGMDKIGYITDLPLETESGKELPHNNQGLELRFENVSFAYDEQSTLLGNFQLHVSSGTRLALLGEGGSGKSTIASLICGLMPATRGIIEINGVEIREIAPSSLRRHIAWTGLGCEIFDGTLEENISLGREWVGSEDIRWALEVTGLSNDLSVLPEGKLTRLVSEGRNLSFGQRQRLMIARAIVDKPQLLILDETLAAIDQQTRLDVIRRISNPRHPWTVVFITTLPEVIQHCDAVAVIENGTLKETGPWQTLMTDTSSWLYAHYHSLDTEVTG